MTGHRVVALVVTVLAVLGVTSCGGADPLTPPGRFAAEADLSGQTFTVGGKEFAEQIVLCTMTIALLQSAGATVVDRCDVQGSGNTRAALVTGQIDMYWEYTGTAWRTYLGQDTTLADPTTLFRAVRDADAENGVAWLEPAPLNNTYAVGARADQAARLGVRSLSDFARLARSGSPEAALCADPEFAGREDGLQGLMRTYGFTLEAGRLNSRTIDEVYPALVAGSPCLFGEVFATDGRLNAERLVTLADDRGYFQPYNAALTVRREALDRAPALSVIGTLVAPLLTQETVRTLNEQVSVAGRAPDEVARTFLREQGLTG